MVEVAKSCNRTSITLISVRFAQIKWTFSRRRRVSPLTPFASLAICSTSLIAVKSQTKYKFSSLEIEKQGKSKDLQKEARTKLKKTMLVKTQC